MLPYLQDNVLACHRFIDAERERRTPRSEATIYYLQQLQ